MSKEKFIREISNLELSTDAAIAKLSQQLHEYEKKYNLRSEIFYKLIVGTPAEDTPDFIGWAMCYRSYFRTLQSKFSIEEINTFLFAFEKVKCSNFFK
jgi:hypothetical protein